MMLTPRTYPKKTLELSGSIPEPAIRSGDTGQQKHYFVSFCSLYKIRRIRKYLSYKSAQTLILALVIGRLDYCNSLLYGLPASYIIKLQRVQNAAARLIISNTTRFDHISPVMKDLHWLPVKYRIMFKLVVYTFKALHGSAPTIFIN